jgi:hypothetical protein
VLAQLQLFIQPQPETDGRLTCTPILDPWVGDE